MKIPLLTLNKNKDKNPIRVTMTKASFGYKSIASNRIPHLGPPLSMVKLSAREKERLKNKIKIGKKSTIDKHLPCNRIILQWQKFSQVPKALRNLGSSYRNKCTMFKRKKGKRRAYLSNYD